MKKSGIETANQVLESVGGSLPFLELWKAVAAQLGLSASQFDDMIAGFYSDLSMDSRFVNLPGNQWDLKKRLASSHTNVDTDSLALEDEEDEEEEEQEEEAVQEENKED